MVDDHVFKYFLEFVSKYQEYLIFAVNLFLILIQLIQVTATHQLKNALRTLAHAARPILLASSARSADMSPEMWESLSKCKRTLVDAMSSTLHGLDANDPPKTLATLQLYSSVLSSVSC